MSKIIKKLDLDIIHSQHPALLGIAARKWAKKKRIPLVFTWHTMYDHYAHFASIIPEAVAARYMIKKAVNYANRSDIVIVPTDSITKKLRQWGVTNEIIPVATGVVEEKFSLVDKNLIRQKYGVKKDEILLLIVSRLTREKNVLFILDAVSQILKDRDKIKLLIVGGGDQLERIIRISENKGIANKIFLAGEISHDKVRDYYAAGDIFIYGSKSETQGMILTEAMYMGLPIVAVSATGTNSLVLNNGNGFLVSENKKEFFAAVWKLINDKDLREKFSEVSKKIAKTNFTSEICAQKMLMVYEKLIKKKNI